MKFKKEFSMGEVGIGKIKQIIPKEDDEDIVFADYCRLKGYLFSHLAQETYTPFWGVRNKNKRIGVNSGIPDFIILVRNKVVFIEMKRIKGGVISEEQQNWIDELNKHGVIATVCRGAEEAIGFLKNI
jgi:hypothetical protein